MASAPGEARIEVHARSDGDEAQIRVKIGRRVLLDTSWTDENGPRAMVSALGEAIAAVARGTVPPRSALSPHTLARKARHATAGRCFLCGCTWERPCEPACWWAPRTGHRVCSAHSQQEIEEAKRALRARDRGARRA